MWTKYIVSAINTVPARAVNVFTLPPPPVDRLLGLVSVARREPGLSPLVPLHSVTVSLDASPADGKLVEKSMSIDARV